MRGHMRIVTKRRMTVCCAILAVIFFAAGLFGLCVPMQAHAEEVTPANIVTADGATVTPEKLNTGANEGDGYDVTGLTVEGGAGVGGARDSRRPYRIAFA